MREKGLEQSWLAMLLLSDASWEIVSHNTVQVFGLGWMEGKYGKPTGTSTIRSISRKGSNTIFSV